MKLDKTHIHDSIYLFGLLISILALPFSIFFCHLGIVILILNWVIQGDWVRKWALLRQNPTAIIFTTFFCWLLVGTIYSENIGNAWSNVEQKFTFSIVPIIIATSKLSEKNRGLLFKSFVFCCATATMVCLGGAIYRSFNDPDISVLNFGVIQPELLLTNPFFTNQWQHFSYVALASGIGMHPTYFSVYLIFCISIIGSEYFKATFNKYLSIALITYFTLFLALLSTRITLLVLLVIALSVIGYFIMHVSKLNLRNLVINLTFTMLFIMLSALNPVSLYREFQEINTTNFRITENTLYSSSIEVRLSLWWTGMRAALKTNPIIGSGTGDTQTVMKHTLQTYNISNVLNTSDPHNQFLYTFISLGSLGLLVLLGCYLLPLKKAWIERDLLHLSFIGLVMLVSLTESFLESQKGIVFFVLFQSLLVFGKSREPVGSKIPIS